MKSVSRRFVEVVIPLTIGIAVILVLLRLIS